MPPSWRCYAWKTGGGYGNQSPDGRGQKNAELERLWFSPHCIPPGGRQGLLALG